MGMERAQKAYFTNFHVTKTIFINLCFLFLWRFHIKSAFDWPIRMFENDGHIHVYIAQGGRGRQTLGVIFFPQKHESFVNLSESAANDNLFLLFFFFTSKIYSPTHLKPKFV